MLVWKSIFAYQCALPHTLRSLFDKPVKYIYRHRFYMRSVIETRAFVSVIHVSSIAATPSLNVTMNVNDLHSSYCSFIGLGCDVTRCCNSHSQCSIYFGHKSTMRVQFARMTLSPASLALMFDVSRTASSVYLPQVGGWVKGRVRLAATQPTLRFWHSFFINRKSCRE